MPLRKITVLSTNVLKSGDGWTLREVVATDENGEGIDKTLKTFENELPIGQLIEVDIEKNPDYDEYVIRLPGSKKGGGGGGGGKQLGASVDLLREQVESLTTRVTAIEGRLAAGAGTPAAASVGASSRPADDDIPF